MIKPIQSLLKVLLFVLVFAFVQAACTLVANKIVPDFLNNAIALIVMHAASAVITIVLFAALKWSPVDRSYLRSKPWAVLIWIVPLTLGTLLPSLWLQDMLQTDMPEEFEKMFNLLMSRPEGYFVVGIMVPLAEEMVFRGAVERTLLNFFSQKWHWAAIILSALIFAVIHGNVPQMIHAFLLGLLIGWMYYRTGSIVPGLVFHWINNSVAYSVHRIFPQWNDAHLVDIFQGNERSVVLAVVFSLFIFLPALWQMALLTRKRA